MTSTNTFIGMNGNRNSSRVLRPPGGGHTDILGITAPAEPQQAKKPSPRNISSIVEGTNPTPPAPVEVPRAPDVEKPQPVTPVDEPVAPRSEPVAPVIEAAAPKPAPACEAPPPANPANKRVRVPPGGFSSGLW